MANERFKVKFGLAVGDTVATIDGTTGNIVTSGNLDVQGGTITESTGALSITTGASNGNITLTPNGTGNVIVSSTLDVQGGTITESTGALTISTGASNANITLDPNGTGNVVMTFANGGNLTNDRNYVNGNIRQTAAASAGDIYGFGNVTYGTTTPYRGISLDNYATSTTTTGKRTGIVMRNYGLPPRNTISGEVARGTNPSTPLTVLANVSLMEITGGGYYGGNTTTPGFLTFTSTGSSISGTTLTIGTLATGTVAVGQVLAGGATAAGTIITGNISGSGSGSTWTVNISQTVGSSAITGGGDGWISSTTNGRSGTISLYTAENWSSTNAGTGFTVATTPIGAYAGTIQTVLDINSNIASYVSDSQTFRTKPVAAGGTNKIMLQLAETASTLTTDTFNINSQANGTSLLSLNTLAGDVALSVNQARATTGFDNALVNFSTFRWSGTQYTPTLNNDIIGEFKFNGNANTGANPGVPSGPGASITANATENWSSTANGTRFDFQAVRTGTLNSYAIISGSTTSLAFNSDTVNINNFDSSVNRVSVSSTEAKFNLPVGFPVDTATNWNAITGAVGRQVCVSDSPTVGGRMAFWDTTNSRWSYISDNSAV